MYDDAIQSEVDALANRLRRSVLVNDPMVRILYRSVHFGDEDPQRIHAILQRDAGDAVVGYVLAQGVAAWTNPGRIPPNEPLGMLHPRVCTPIHWRGEMVGMIMMVDLEDSLTEVELTEINRTAHSLAPLLAPSEEDFDDHQTVRDLLAEDPAVRRQALKDFSKRQSKSLGGHESRSPGTTAEYAVVVRIGARASPEPGAAHPTYRNTWTATTDIGDRDIGHIRTAMYDAVTTQFALRLSLQRSYLLDETAVVLLGSDTPIERDALRAETSRVLRRIEDVSAGRFEALAGLGSCVSGLDRAHESGHQAAVALKAAQRIRPKQGRLGNPVFWEDLGSLGILLRLPDEHLTHSALPNEVQRLLESVPVGELIRTLQVYLDYGGHGPGASEALHIHRTTLYYRLGRISELAGLDLSDSQTRLTLHLGLTMWEMLGDRA